MLTKTVLVVAVLTAAIFGESKSELNAGETLMPGQYLVSASGSYRLCMQGDGNLVLYGPLSEVLWASQTCGQNQAQCQFQSDGNLVLYNVTGRPIWSSSTFNRGATRITLQDDGNLVIYSGSQPVWSRVSGLIAATSPPNSQHRSTRKRPSRTLEFLAGLARVYVDHRQEQRQMAEQQRLSVEVEKREDETRERQLAEHERHKAPVQSDQQQTASRSHHEEANGREAERVAREVELMRTAQMSSRETEEKPVLHNGLVDLAVITGQNPVPSGFEKIDVDLNRRAKGAYLYLCCKYGLTENPICDLTAVQVHHGQSPQAEGFTFLNVDLNQGTRGRPIFLGFRRSKSGPAILGIHISSDGDRGRALGNYWEHGFAHVGDRGYPNLVNLDLNAGAGGDYIYLRFKR